MLVLTKCRDNIYPGIQVKGMEELITEFDQTLWTVLVESVTVEKERMVFRFNGGVEVPYLRS